MQENIKYASDSFRTRLRERDSEPGSSNSKRKNKRTLCSKMKKGSK